MPSLSFVEWCLLPTTIIAVWLPSAFSLLAVIYRVHQRASLKWWFACLGFGLFFGLSLTRWVPGTGLYIVPGFLVAYLLWFNFLANVPHRYSDLMEAPSFVFARFTQTTDPLLVSAGVFFSVLFTDVIHAFLLARAGVSGWGTAWFYGIGGAGFGDSLFASTMATFLLFYSARRIVTACRLRREYAG